MEDKLEPSIAALVERVDLALAEDDVELSALRKEVDARDAELFRLRNEIVSKSELARLLEAEKVELQKQVELTLVQLHEAQKEIEHYFLLSQKQSQLLQTALELHSRAMLLLTSSIK